MDKSIDIPKRIKFTRFVFEIERFIIKSKKDSKVKLLIFVAQLYNPNLFIL